MQYMSLSKVASLLDVTLGIARNWCKQNNIRAISLGTGRGRGMRYLLVDIENSLETQSICMGKTETEKPVKPKIPRHRPFYGKTIAEQVALVFSERIQ